MRRQAPFFMGVAILHIGCKSSVEVFDDDPGAQCSSDLEHELAALDIAVGAIEGMELRHRDAMARACANIVGDLTHMQAPSAEGLSHEEAGNLCKAAHSMIEMSISQGDEVTIALEDPGGCTAEGSTEGACVGAHGTTPVVAAACSAAGIFVGMCIDPTLEATSTDPILAETFNENFPTILALDISVANHAGDGVDVLLDGVFTPLTSRVECEQDAAELGDLANRSSAAMDQIVDLLTWVRISVIMNGG